MTKIIFWMLLISAFIMGVYACLPVDAEPTQPGQVNIPLYSVADQQQELIDRGHKIKKDGKHGVNTELALTIEVTKGE